MPSLFNYLLGASRILENFQGIHVGTNLIIRLQNGETLVYNEDVKLFYTSSTEDKFSKIHGGCYVTINSTHFIQIGGSFNGGILKAVYMIELKSDFKSRGKKDRFMLELTKMPHLDINRMYHGCTKGIINDSISIIVAGGIGENDEPLTSIEYLTISINQQMKMPIHSDAVIFSDEEDGVNEVNDEKWKKLPSMKIARSHFPTIIFSNGALSIAGGKCIPDNTTKCNIIEVLNVKTCQWGFDKHQLSGTRYNHNDAQMPLINCNNQLPCSTIRDGFNVGNGLNC